jgi:hypothetical protein
MSDFPRGRSGGQVPRRTCTRTLLVAEQVCARLKLHRDRVDGTSDGSEKCLDLTPACSFQHARIRWTVSVWLVRAHPHLKRADSILQSHANAPEGERCRYSDDIFRVRINRAICPCRMEGPRWLAPRSLGYLAWLHRAG